MGSEEADIDRILERVTVPDTGLVLRATWDDPTDHLSRAERTDIIRVAYGSAFKPVRGSTDQDGHWVDIVQVSDRYWVTRYFDEAAYGEECVIFKGFEDAYAHYEQVVRGQQDASSGTAWRECDVPGVLAGEELNLAERVGYSYEDASRQYAEDRAAAVAAWSMLNGLRST